jgi:hypothetical protein
MGFFPSDYRPASASGGQGDSQSSAKRYFECSGKYLKDGETATLRPCGSHDSGHVIAGFSYFSMEGRPKRFPKWPENYLEDVGLTYEAKQNGLDPADPANRSKPKYFLSFCALSRESDDFVVATLDKKGIREQFEEILAMEDYTILPSGMANFFVTIKRKGNDVNTSWLLTPTLKAPSKADEKRWADASAGIWLPALYTGADPFAGKPADARPEGLPPTHRDSLGADQEIATSTMPEGW